MNSRSIKCRTKAEIGNKPTNFIFLDFRICMFVEFKVVSKKFNFTWVSSHSLWLAGCCIRFIDITVLLRFFSVPCDEWNEFWCRWKRFYLDIHTFRSDIEPCNHCRSEHSCEKSIKTLRDIFFRKLCTAYLFATANRLVISLKRFLIARTVA